MSAEGLHIFTKEELAAKQSVQIEIMKRLCPNPGDNECMLEWIDKYASLFSDAFGRRMFEPDFITRCNAERDKVVDELIQEVGVDLKQEKAA